MASKVDRPDIGAFRPLGFGVGSFGAKEDVMADYSYVTVEFALDRMTDDIELLANQAGRFCDRVDGEFLVTVEEARYGFPVPIGGDDFAGDPLTWDLVKELTHRGIAFRGYDAGGHEWPEQEYAWSPVYGWKARQLDGTGKAVLADHQFRRLTESGHRADRLVAELAKHFQNDPEGWL